MPTRSSASGGSDPVEYLDLEDLIDLATLLHGSPPPIRDVGLLGSAAARPQASAFGEDAYPDLWHKAAALLHSIVKNHALVDGNKRLGWLATATFLEINGVSVTSITNDDVVELVTDVAAHRREVAEIAAALAALAAPAGFEPGQPEAQGRARGSS
jgi:death-on-curing protein